MKHYFTKTFLLTFLVLSQLIFLPPSSAAPYNNNVWQQQQAAQVQRDARAAADRARRDAQIAAQRAKRNAKIAADNAKKEAARAAEDAKRNAKNIANQNKKNALRSMQSQNLTKNQKIQNSLIQQKTTQDLQKQRAMERTIQKTIQNQKQQVANDNQKKIKEKLDKLKRIKQLKERDKNKKQLADKKKKEKKNNNRLIRQTLSQDSSLPSGRNKVKVSSGGSGSGNNKGSGTGGGGGKKGNGSSGDGGNGNEPPNRKALNEAAKLAQIKKNQSSLSTKTLNRKINDKVPKGTKPAISAQKQAGHIPGTPQNANRLKQGKPTSSFFGEKSGERLTQQAFEKGKPVPGRPNVREHDFGVSTGTGPNGGMQTRVRVHQDSKGRIHGHPSGPERY